MNIDWWFVPEYLTILFGLIFIGIVIVIGIGDFFDK